MNRQGEYAQSNYTPPLVTNLIRSKWPSGWVGMEQAQEWFVEEPYFSQVSRTLCKPNGYFNSLIIRAEFIHRRIGFFLTGISKNQRRIYEEVRISIFYYPEHGPEVIGFVLLNLTNELLGREWYELMPAYEKVIGSLKKRFDIDPMTNEEAKTKRFPTQPPIR